MERPVDRPTGDVEPRPGDLVLARGADGRYHAVVRGVRLGRLVVERCDGRPAGPLALRDVVCVYRSIGSPSPEAGLPVTERKRPTGQLRFEV